MKKLWRILAGITLALPAHAVAHAAEGHPYAGAQAGMFLPIKSSVSGAFVGEDAKLTYNTGFILSAVGGYDFGNGLRAEGEASYRNLTTDNLVNERGLIDVHSAITSYSFMANLYYDFRTRTVITPYIGAGVGLAVADFDSGSSNGRVLWTSDSDTAVAYQGIAGFALRLNADTSLDFAYRHFAIPRLHFDNLSAQFRGPNLSLGIRRRF